MILQAAARLLAEDPSASMQAIADAAGVSRPTVYRRFPSRDELIDAIRNEALAEVLERLEAAAASQEPAAGALERLIRELAGVAARYPLLLELFRRGQQHGPPAQKPALPQVARAFDALVARGLRDGTLRTGLRADVLRQVTIGGLAVALRLGHASGRDPEAIGSDVASIVLGGVRAG
jgi:TetR/AcrR family transcriptional repressor of mexCD-oprJ operon